MVLFTSVRPLDRAENLKAVYDAYDGPKEYVQRYYNKPIPDISSGKYRLVVTDGLMEESPGKYIWIGHGMGAGKTIGLQHPTTPFKGSSLVTYAIASSPEMVPIVAGFCGISEEQVIPLGMPRTDAYLSMEYIPHEGRHHLYAPTFRSGSWMPDFNKIWRTMPEGHELTVKLHMVTGDRFRSHWQHIKAASSMIPSTPFLVNTDTVITDYSSIMFDAYLLGKPAVLFEKSAGYATVRGMYLDYPEEYCSRYATNEKDMVQMARFANGLKQTEKACLDYVADMCDGHSCERICQLIDELN